MKEMIGTEVFAVVHPGPLASTAAFTVVAAERVEDDGRPEEEKNVVALLAHDAGEDGIMYMLTMTTEQDFTKPGGVFGNGLTVASFGKEGNDIKASAECLRKMADHLEGVKTFTPDDEAEQDATE